MLLTEENYTCELSKETQEIAKKELNETNKLRKKAIADVRKWIKSQSHFRRARLDASFILRFLRMQKFDTKESCEILDKYLTMRVQHPTWFQNLDCRVRVRMRGLIQFRNSMLTLPGSSNLRPRGQGIHLCFT